MGIMVAETYSVKVREILYQGTCMCFIDVSTTNYHFLLLKIYVPMYVSRYLSVYLCMCLCIYVPMYLLSHLMLKCMSWQLSLLSL